MAPATPPISSLTPEPKVRRAIYRSVKHIHERLERALAPVLNRTRTSGELLRTASPVRGLRLRNTRSTRPRASAAAGCDSSRPGFPAVSHLMTGSLDLLTARALGVIFGAAAV